jgi:hypothetical protein
LDGAFGSILLHKTEKSIENDDRANWGRIQIVTEQRGNRRGNDQNDDHELRELFLSAALFVPAACNSLLPFSRSRRAASFSERPVDGSTARPRAPSVRSIWCHGGYPAESADEEFAAPDEVEASVLEGCRRTIIVPRSFSCHED